MIKTAEYCRKGHPDRVCDIVVDALLDEYLKQDPNSRVALNAFGAHGIITVGGEVTTKANVDVAQVVKSVYHEIGYKNNIGVQVNIVRQSSEIKVLADTGAGDSGIMIGYATRETPEMLPKEVVITKRICSNLDGLPFLMPDGKIQVTMKNGEIDILVVSVQGNKGVEDNVRKILAASFPHKKLFLTIFQLGGFDADSGLTGRKNILWYGPEVPTGGGTFAGKDATKVDRSGAYMARKLAIDLLKRNQFYSCLVKLAYIIGNKFPVMAEAEFSDDVGNKKRSLKLNVQDLEVRKIIKRLNLRNSIFKEASFKGHFGDKKFSWEK